MRFSNVEHERGGNVKQKQANQAWQMGTELWEWIESKAPWSIVTTHIKGEAQEAISADSVHILIIDVGNVE